ncbi:hypothetical protein SEA_Fireman_96 [Microbacterium phage Fireman]|uniref:Uncharacterized protein n=1 Tax=Microbacterium phage Fireman TaxID=2530118 RepID=A0A4V1FV33_9CAUD|nr:hypothetical protein HOV22_gp84 [Microbacterium phage Fireman]QCS26971.1 hypothetical protein SEA_Fireman_96 [Microbacterium phage Fireman]
MHLRSLPSAPQSSLARDRTDSQSEVVLTRIRHRRGSTLDYRCKPNKYRRAHLWT